MEKLFTTTSLVSVLLSLTIRSTKCMTHIWHDKIQEKHNIGNTIAVLKSEGTKSLVERLYKADLAYSEIKDKYVECTSKEQFVEWLKGSGVRLKFGIRN